MALNVLSTLIVNGTEFIFGSDPEAEKLSLSVEIPSWQIEVKAKKVVTGWANKSYSKRAFNSLESFMDSEMPDRFFLNAVDQNLPGLRGFLGKNDIRDLRGSATSQDEDGNYSVNNVHSFCALVQTEFDRLTPKSGSLADPELEAKKSIAKSQPFHEIVWTEEAVQDHFQAVITEKLAEIERFRKASENVSLADLKAYTVEKFTSNGVDDDGYVRLKGQKEEK